MVAESGLNSNQIKNSRGWQGNCHNLSTASSLILRLYSFKQNKAKITTKQKTYQWLVNSQISIWWNWGDVLERSSCSERICLERDFEAFIVLNTNSMCVRNTLHNSLIEQAGQDVINAALGTFDFWPWPAMVLRSHFFWGLLDFVL